MSAYRTDGHDRSPLARCFADAHGDGIADDEYASLARDVTERNDEASQATMYNTLLIIDERGEVIGRHRQLVPTGGERLVWAQGDAAELRVHETRCLQLRHHHNGRESDPGQRCDRHSRLERRQRVWTPAQYRAPGSVVEGNRIGNQTTLGTYGIFLQDERDVLVANNRLIGWGIGVSALTSGGGNGGLCRDNFFANVTTLLSGCIDVANNN
jgi:hypothetical protein